MSDSFQILTKEQGLKKVEELVARFQEHLTSYKKAEYNETMTRRDFIDPLFVALGWDIDNKLNLAESYREVIHEDKVKVGTATKAPDYSFRYKEKGKLFFVEAKKPNIGIKDDIQPAYQVRRYGWSAKLNVSILTDFEEFAVYDCTKKPKPTDKSSTARVKYLTYTDYVKEWDFLWDTFSKEAISNGNFEKFFAKNATKKGTETVDKEFLISLDQWRTLLAESISKENKQLDEDELNFVVQQTLDRIIFLRICEDRSIEQYGKLKECVKSGEYYKNLLSDFKQADDKYNSGLFDFKKDSLSHQISINNKTLKTIINQLYYPESPYEFSVLSVEILGSAYEQFLGKTITINNRGKAVIELKPEVRKAGGVYYTPQYIVDYIVKNTVGKLCENKTPAEVAEVKIVDPACGSGSFLLGAYQFLLNWHKDYYFQHPHKKNPLTPDGNLTTSEKKKILLNNIYGVDIDVNAVEVTKLSLLLKCMEGESLASIEHQMAIFKERVLPTLDDNIKSGNSLIDTDYYDNQIDFGEERKIKPFNWQKAFPSVFKKGGFDVVIGNPPYVLIEGEFRHENMISFFREKYYCASYKLDLYHLFIEKGIKLLCSKGRMGYITPSNFLSNNGLVKLRETILNESFIDTINVISGKVFVGASVDTTISLLTKEPNNKNSKFILSDWKETHLVENKVTVFNQENFYTNDGKMFISTEEKINLNVLTYELGERYSVKFGMQLRDRKLFKGDVIKADDFENITSFHRPCYTGKNVNLYNMSYENLMAFFNKDAKRGGCWDEEIHNSNPKIIVRQIGVYPICAIDLNGYCCLNTVFMVVPKSGNNENLFFTLGILNSKFIQEYWKKNFSDKRGTFPKIKGSYLEKLPIPVIDHKNSKSDKAYKEIINLVESILELRIEETSSKLNTKKEQILQRIDYNIDKINRLVYQLYELTDEEIAKIENS